MKNLTRQLPLALGLILLSIIVYIIHYMLFHDPHHIFVFLVEDIAFVFIEVLLVTFIIHRLLEDREKKHRMEKMNMVIGVFFSELGTDLLRMFSSIDQNVDEIKNLTGITGSWKESQFKEAESALSKHKAEISLNSTDLSPLKELVVGKRDFLVRLLENPNLLEHESFTDVLQAVFHLVEELSVREDLSNLPQSDVKHISGDFKRVIDGLSLQWLDYMKHLQTEYPYLFSLAIRMNPFNAEASPVVVS